VRIFRNAYAIYIFSLMAALMMQSIVAAAALAQDLGTISRLEGSAQVQRGGNTVQATLSMGVQLHDRITTGKNSYLTISMLGGSAMTLSSDSTLTIDESANIGGTEAPRRVGLLAGGLHTIISGAMRSSSSTAFEVHTPNAVGAVRGTEWDEVYERGEPRLPQYKDCREYTEVWVEDGIVHVANPNVPGNPGQDVTKGHYVIVACDHPPLAATAAAGAGPGMRAFMAAGLIAPAAGIAAGVAAGTSGGGGSQKPSSPSF